VRPALIISSPLRRARETAEVAAELLEYGGAVAEWQTLLPETSSYDLWEELRRHGEEPVLLLAGHEPLMRSRSPARRFR